MFNLLKKHVYSIGVDVSEDGLKLVQLGNNGNAVSLIAGVSENQPEGIDAGSIDWQKWVIQAVQQLTSNGNFQGKEVIAAMPACDVFIDNMKMPKAEDGDLQNAVFSRIKQKLPFEAVPDNTMIKYVQTEQDNVLVMAIERKIIDRHLAIYEKAGLTIKSIGVWPFALVNCYTKFFGRRASDLQTIVMLIYIEPNSTNVVICRHKNLLFARCIPIGATQLDDEPVMTRLVLELTASRRQFGTLQRNCQIERMIFLSSRAADRDKCLTIAKQLEMPAQVGDCLAAVEMPDSIGLNGADTSNGMYHGTQIDRRDCQLNWAVAFGLSLS
jgi:type IV pilus assembly protein PilM